MSTATVSCARNEILDLVTRPWDPSDPKLDPSDPKLAPSWTVSYCELCSTSWSDPPSTNSCTMDILGGCTHAPSTFTILGWSNPRSMSISRLNSASCSLVAPTPPRCSNFTATSVDAGLTSAAR